MTTKEVDGGYHDGDLDGDDKFQESVRKTNKEFIKKRNPEFHDMMERVTKERDGNN